MIERVLARLVNRIEQLEAIVNQQDRRLNNMIREGAITDVDPAKGLAKADIGGMKSNWSPWSQRAGAGREWDPVTVGERVLFISPTGEPGNGIIMPGGFSTEFAQNHDQAGVYRRTHGDSYFEIGSGGVNIVAGGTTFSFTSGGFDQQGGGQTHDGKNVGSTHGHVSAPPGPPGPPV